MSNRTIPINPSSIQKCWLNANAYRHVFEEFYILYKNGSPDLLDYNDSNLSAAIVVNGSFARELYFKFIYLYEEYIKQNTNQITIEANHSFYSFYKKLNLSIRNKLYIEFANKLPISRNSFRTFLKKSSKYFESGRYLFEKCANTKFDTHKLEILIEVLYNYTRIFYINNPNIKTPKSNHYTNSIIIS